MKALLLCVALALATVLSACAETGPEVRMGGSWEVRGETGNN